MNTMQEQSRARRDSEVSGAKESLLNATPLGMERTTQTYKWPKHALPPNFPAHGVGRYGTGKQSPNLRTTCVWNTRNCWLNLPSYQQGRWELRHGLLVLRLVITLGYDLPIWLETAICIRHVESSIFVSAPSDNLGVSPYGMVSLVVDQ